MGEVLFAAFGLVFAALVVRLMVRTVDGWKPWVFAVGITVSVIASVFLFYYVLVRQLADRG